MNRSPLARTLLASAVFAVAIALAGCEPDSRNISSRALAPIPDKTLAEMARKSMAKESPILVRLFKQEAELEVWKQDSSGKLALLKTYPICRWSGDLGPKIKEGDRQAPEGFYDITPGQMNPNSSLYLSFNLGYPNAFDQAHSRTGSYLMVHGDCSSRGCYSMTDEQIAEIYALARESFFAGQRSFQVQAYPFRMTPANMAKHRNNPHMPFWKMLKEGNDHFEVTRMEPKVDVCERRYVFNAAASGQPSTALKFDARGQCPVYQVPDNIVAAVAEKQRRDDTRTADLINRGTPAAPIKMATDGGMHEVFAAALQGGRPVIDKDGEIQRRIPVVAPGTIPPTVNPPSNVRLVAATPEPQTTTVLRTDGANAGPAPREARRVPTRTASAQPPAASSTSSSAGLFGSSDSALGIFDRAARAIGLRGSDTSPSEVTKAAPPASRPAPASTPVSSVARAATQPVRPKPQPLVERVEPPARIANAATANSASRASLLSGAAPVVPTGSFGANWFAPR